MNFTWMPSFAGITDFLRFRKKSIVIAAVFFILIFSCSNLMAKELEQEFKVWNELAVENAFKKGSKWHYSIQNILRFRTKGRALEEEILRLGLGYALGPKTKLWLGYDNRSIYPQKRFEKEQRAWQQLSHDILSSDSLKIFSRTRLEQRFREGRRGTSSRLRQQLTLKFPVSKTCYGVLYDELFFNLNHPVWVSRYNLDQNRMFIGLEFPSHSKVKILLGYLNQYIQATPKNIMNHILFLKMELRL